MKYRIEMFNLDGQGPTRHRVYDMPRKENFWASVTNVPCPREGCDGTILWHEAGFVPGYRKCDTCKRHFLASGNEQIVLVLDGRY